MQAAPKHTIPAYLFELQHGEDTLHDGGSDIHGVAGEVPGRHHAADLRQCSSGTGSFRECGNARDFTLACDEKTDRFGPGRLSIRHNHTKRLRELRARRSAGPVCSLRNANHVPRGVGGGNVSLKARTDGTALADICGSKRRRASSGGEYQVESQRLPLERPAVLVQPIPQQPEVPTTGRLGAGNHNTSRHPSRGRDGCSQGYCGSWSRGDSGPNKALAAGNRTPGTAEDGGRRRRINASMVPLDSLDERPSIDSGSTNNSGNSGQPATVRLSRIIPVRSAPVSWRPLAATGASGVLSRSGSKKTPHVCEKYVQQHNSHKQQKHDATTSVAGGGLAEGVALTTNNTTVAGIREATIAPSNAKGAVGNARASHEDDECKSLGSLAASRQGFPGIADTCGGIALRLTPGERPLEPWGTTLAPLRAMCDIEPSLSRAGMEFRAVIHAVEGAQELKSHHHIKRKKARDAKSLLGKDARPRTSEPRLRIAGVKSELDVLKAIIVRERLIVTLRRLIRRLRRHCSKLQDFLRREIKFRWRYGKPPPEVLVCATQSVRKTVHTEQQELRVVLAHLRAISLDTVQAISEWRATFETSERPGYRQISRTVSAPSLHGKPSLLRYPAEQEEICHSGSSACHGGQTTEKLNNYQNNRTENAAILLSGGAHLRQEKGGETDTQCGKGFSFRGGDNDSKAVNPKTAPRQGIDSRSRSNPSTIFLWKGRNYLVKMAHDLDFLDDENMAAPVPAWLGFSVHRNPFLIPPEGHDIREVLRLGHEERCNEIAVRRRQRQQQYHRFGGTGNGQRRSSRSPSRSRTNSGTNRPRGSGDRDLFASRSHRQSGQEQESDPGCRSDKARSGVLSPEATTMPPYQNQQPLQPSTAPDATENDLPPRAGSIALPRGREGDDTFVTEGGITTTAESLASASTSVEPPLSWSLGDMEDEDIACELSSGEEEEVQWSGGGFLELPIIPELPEAVRSKASDAAETLRNEGAAENDLESSALEIVANAKRTKDILHQPDQEHSSRVEWLAERSFRNGLRGALVNRHVGATRLKSASSTLWWEDEPLARRVSTAPAGWVGDSQRTRRSCASSAVAKSATSKREIQDQQSSAVGNSRGGVCVSVDGGGNERTENAHESLTPAQSRRFANGSRNSNSRRRGAPASRLRHPDAPSARVSEGSTGSVSATSLAGRSMTASSLQASSSSMSGRARARAVAIRPTALRRPFCRNGGRIIITDPGNLPEIRHKAAILIQSAILAVCARLFVRRLQAVRERAALLIGQNWRRSRVRLRMWNAKRSRRAEELRQVAEGRARNRAAYLLQIFFRDIKYRRKRDRQELALKNREHIPTELREKNAVIMVQATIRRCLASNRLKRIRHRRRGQAQARIARAARERAMFARRKELADREREEENALEMGMMRKPKSLRLDEAAIRVQAWFRGVNCRRTIVAAAFSAKEPTLAKKAHPRGSKSAHLRAALDALREAHSAIKNTENEKGKINQEARRRPAEDQSPRARKGVVDTDGCSNTIADEVRWEARVSERQHTPSRVPAER